MCITIDDLDDDINSQGFIKSLSIGCYQLSMLPNNVRLRVAFAISGNNFATETATAPHSWSGFQKISESELHLVQYGH